MKRFYSYVNPESPYSLKEGDDGEYVFYYDYAVLKAKHERLVSAAKTVVLRECILRDVPGQEPYDPLANPGQFTDEVVALARAIEESEGE